MPFGDLIKRGGGFLGGALVFIGGELIKGIGREIKGPQGDQPLPPRPGRPPPTIRDDPAGAPYVPVTSPYVSPPINEPKRQRGNKAKRKKPGVREAELTQILGAQGIWPYSVFSDKFSTADKVRQSIAMSGLQTAIGRGMTVKLPKGMQKPSPGMGTRSSQRGFVAPEFVPLIADPPMPAKPAPVKTSPAPRRLPSRPLPRTAPALDPAPAPQPFDPTRPYGEPIERTTEPGRRAEPRPGTPERVPDRQPQPARTTPASPKPGIPGTRRTGRAPAAVPGTVLTGLLDLTGRTAIGYVVGGRRPGGNRGLTQLPGVPQIDPRIPFAQPLPQSQPQRTRTKDEDCECDKPKKREPRKARTVCKSGTYKQTSRGVSYNPTKEIPCVA